MDLDDALGLFGPGQSPAPQPRLLAEASELLCLHPRDVQRRVLADILRANSHTEMGARFDFSRIKSYEAFAAQVPLCGWRDYEPAMARMAAGEEDVLFPGRAACFLKTSGSTGANKLVPQSAAGMALNRAVSTLRSHHRQRAAAEAARFSPEDLPRGRVLVFPASGHVGTTAGGIPVGFASGVTSAGAAPERRGTHCCPPEVFAVEDAPTRNFLILLFALRHRDVVAAMGNNPRRFQLLLETAQNLAPQLIETIKNGVLPPQNSLGEDTRASLQSLLHPNPGRAAELLALHSEGRFTPAHYWPHFNMACFWLAGPMAFCHEGLRPLLSASTLFFDAGYGASELKINLPMTAGSPYGPPALFAGFFEFLPQDGGPPLLANELEEGGVYEMVLTTYSGLYRYRLGDYIEVKGRTGQTPNIAYHGRVGDVVNLAGEKTGGGVLLRAAALASGELGTRLLSCAFWPNPAGPAYHCFYEAQGDPVPGEAWAEALDQHLQALSAGYRRRRKDGALAPAAATRMPTGWREAPSENTAAVPAQQKPPLILQGPPNVAPPPPQADRTPQRKKGP